MNKKVLKTLEYDKIIERLASYATCEAGRSYCEKIGPQRKLSEAKKYMTQTEDALERLIKYGPVSFAGTRDMSEYMKHLEIGSTLGITELIRVADLLSAADRAKRYGGKDERGNEINDSLSTFFDELTPLNTLKKEIDRVIISEDEIADDASPELSSIRRQKAR